jgi:hypothetical protein
MCRYKQHIRALYPQAGQEPQTAPLNVSALTGYGQANSEHLNNIGRYLAKLIRQDMVDGLHACVPFSSIDGLPRCVDSTPNTQLCSRLCGALCNRHVECGVTAMVALMEAFRGSSKLALFEGHVTELIRHLLDDALDSHKVLGLRLVHLLTLHK